VEDKEKEIIYVKIVKDKEPKLILTIHRIIQTVLSALILRYLLLFLGLPI